MGNKQRKRVVESALPPTSSVPQVPIEDDPYWNLSSIFSDPSRIARYVHRFQSFCDRYPQWGEDLMGGVPTYYCVLGCPRGTAKDEILKAFERERAMSPFSGDTIEEAYCVLSDPKLQKKYDEFLSFFEPVSRGLPPEGKVEIKKTHQSLVDKGKIYKQISGIKEVYTDYMGLNASGMPDIYEIAGLDRNCDDEAIRNACQKDDEFSKKVFSLLIDPTMRNKFDLIHEFFETQLSEENRAAREDNREIWEDIDPLLVQRVMLLSLNDSNGFTSLNHETGEILNQDQDWKFYLPPSDTFFSILGIDMSSVTLPKSEFESMLRLRYRELERTTRVNLAYTVLKNTSLREKYLFLYKNYEVFEVNERLVSKKQERERECEPEWEDGMDLSEVIPQEILRILRRLHRM